MDNYAKYKERSPEETVAEIRRILEDAGLSPVARQTGDPSDGFFSCRVELPPSSCGTNGKGTSEAYSLASGLAELMERLQNNALFTRPGWSVDPSGPGFTEAPDESRVDLEDLLSDPDPYTRVILSALAGEDGYSDGRALCQLLSVEADGSRFLQTLPYRDLAGGETVMLPIRLVRYYDSTNGMAAGNTMEEAVVQGLSELMEREATRLIVEGEAVPPEIPDEALEGFSFYPLIRRLRSDGRYRISFLDCSLGRGWPVAAFCITDLETGTFGIRFGAHPSFPVAVERTLTEAAQGHGIERYAAFCRVGTPEEVARPLNLVNIMVNGRGAYPASIFTEEPGWEFRPWTRFRSMDNRGLLRELTQFLTEEGHRILVRDATFLGFPACHVVIPGFRRIRVVSGASVRLKRSLLRAADSWKRFPDLSEEEAARILRLIRYYESAAGDPAINRITGLPLRPGLYSDARAGAWLALRLEDFPAAAHFFGKLCRRERAEEERRAAACLEEYCRRRSAGFSDREAQRLVRQFHPGEAAERACADVAALQTGRRIPARLFPRMSCPDCASCALSGKDCAYPAEAELYGKAAAAIRKASRTGRT